MVFDLQHTDCTSHARAGRITTGHGVIETPIFMPVGTVGSVKAVQVPEGFSAGALDFASSPIAFLIYACMKYLFTWIGAAILTALTVVMLVWNRVMINKK